MQLVGVAWAVFVPIAIIITSKNVDIEGIRHGDCYAERAYANAYVGEHC